MIITAQTFPQKFPEIFKNSTRIAIQIKTGNGTVSIAKEQGEIANAAPGSPPNDGLSLTAAGTVVPWAEWWKGELWYVSDIVNQPFVIEILTD